MAARRLLIVMIVLLVLSSVAAALVPAPPEPQPPEETETTTTAPGEDRSGRVRSGELLTARLSADARRPERVAVRVGDQLSLTVTSKAYREVEVPALGLIESAAAGSPARFDIFVDRPGSFLVRLLDGGRAIARIEAAKPRGASRSARRDGARARAGGRRAGPES